MAFLERGVTEIAALLKGIGDLKNSPYIIKLEREIASATEKLETATSTLNSVTAFNNETKDNYDLGKSSLTSLKADLGSLTNSYQELFNLIGINYTDETFNKLESDVAKYVSSQKDLIDSYKVQIASLNEEIRKLTEEIKGLQERLREQTSVRDQLITYTKQAESGDLSLSKNELSAFLKSIVDENGVQVFEEAELSIAAQIITFSENFNLNESGKTVGAVLQAAMDQPAEDINPVEAFEPEAIDNIYNLMESEPALLEEPERFTFPENLTIADMSPKTDQTTDFEAAKEELTKEPTGEPDPYDLIAELEAETPVSEVKSPRPSNVIPFPTSKSVTHTDEEMTRFNENIGYLKSIGISTDDIKKYPATLYAISIEDIKEGLAIANKAGIKPKGIGDIVALCSRNDVERLLEGAIEESGSEYAEMIKKTSLCKILETAKQHIKEAKITNSNLEQLIPEITELKSFKDEVSGNYAWMIAYGMEDKLSTVAKSTPYAYIINGVHIPRQRFERNLQRLSNLDISNQDLLLAAIAYDSKLTKDEMVMLKGEIAKIIPVAEDQMRMAA